MTKPPAKIFLDRTPIQAPYLHQVDFLRMNFCSSLEEADFIVFPYLIDGIQDRLFLLRIVQTYIGKRFYGMQKKPRIIVFLRSDFDGNFVHSNHVFLFSLGAHRSQKTHNQILYPYIWHCSENPLPVLPAQGRPRIGFCGHPKHPSRKAMIQAIQNDPNLVADFVLRDQFWGGRPHAPDLVKDFWENIGANHFTICCRGAANFSIRFFQVLSAGRIPILIDTDISFPWPDYINWEDFVICEETPQKVLNKVHEWWQTKDLEEKQTQCRRMWENFLSVPGFNRQLQEWADDIVHPNKSP